MADNITLTAAMRSNLLTLQSTTSNIGKIQNVLATGKKVNSALDDPTAFFASQALLNRSNDLSALLDGMGQSIQTLKAADDGITSITSLINQMKSVAQSAKDGATNSANATAFSEDFTLANQSGAAFLTAIGGANTDTIQISVNGVALPTVALATGDSLSSVAAKIDALNGISASVVAGETAGTLRMKVVADTAGQSLTFTDTAEVLVTEMGWKQDDAAGTAYTSGVAVLPGTGAPVDMTSLQTSYDGLRTQITQLVEDAGYRGTNLLNDQDLITTFNEDGTSSQTVQGVEYTVGAAGSRIAVSAADFSSVASIDAAIAEISDALTNLRADSKIFGNALAVVQTREDFTKKLIANLKEGSDKLVLADTNEEGAKLLSLQTSQQLGIQALSLAAQSQQAVLQLFR